MMNDPLLIALIASLILNCLLTPLGCFLVWQRMAFLGDTMAHSAILGVALGVLLHLPNKHFGSLIYLLGFVFLLKTSLAHKKQQDTTLSLLSYGGMSLGLILLHGQKIDVSQLLFGDFLTLGLQDILILASLTSLVWLFLLTTYKKLILYVLDRDLAKQSGINVEGLETLFLLLTAVVIAISMHYVGALIVPALLIIPCTAVYKNAKNPNVIMKKALLFGAFLAPLSVILAYFNDFPVGPTMVCSFLLGVFSLRLQQTLTKNKQT